MACEALEREACPRDGGGKGVGFAEALGCEVDILVVVVVSSHFEKKRRGNVELRLCIVCF